LGLFLGRAKRGLRDKRIKKCSHGAVSTSEGALQGRLPRGANNSKKFSLLVCGRKSHRPRNSAARSSSQRSSYGTSGSLPKLANSIVRETKERETTRKYDKGRKGRDAPDLHLRAITRKPNHSGNTGERTEGGEKHGAQNSKINRASTADFRPSSRKAGKQVGLVPRQNKKVFCKCDAKSMVSRPYLCDVSYTPIFHREDKEKREQGR